MVPEQNLVARHWNTPCIMTRTGQHESTFEVQANPGKNSAWDAKTSIQSTEYVLPYQKQNWGQ